MRDAVSVSRRGVNLVVGIASLALVVMSAAGTYWATLASQSGGPAVAYPGWITVLQRTAAPSKVQFRLDVEALADGSQTRMSYGVAMCGAGTASGYLLAGGASVLSDESTVAAEDTVHELGTSDLRASTPFSSTSKNLGPVQAWRFEIPDLPPCIGDASDSEFVGAVFRVEGLASRPIRAKERFGPFRSSTETRAMPYVGNLPGAGQTLGEFELEGVISGSFMRPASLASDADAGAVALNMAMRDARPSTVADDRALWHELRPFQPTVRVEDSSAAALLQRLSTASSIVLGLAGAILTAYVFELVRGRRSLYALGNVPTDDGRADDAIGVDPPLGRRTEQDGRDWWPLLVVAAILGAVIRLVTSRRNESG